MHLHPQIQIPNTFLVCICDLRLIVFHELAVFFYNVNSFQKSSAHKRGLIEMQYVLLFNKWRKIKISKILHAFYDDDICFQSKNNHDN